MTIKLTETIIPALQARLQTQLPTVIADINTNNVTPVYSLDIPAQVLDFVPSLADLWQFPTIAISDGEISLEDDVGFGATGVCEVSVIAFIVNPDQRALAWQLRRYAQAIVRAVRITNYHNLGEGWGVYNFRVRPGPTLGRDREPAQWISTIAVTFFIKSEQDA